MVLKSVEPKNVICDLKTADLPPQMTNLNAVISILMHLFIFSVEKVYYSRLSLSRTSRDLIKMFELSAVRDNQIVTS